MSDNQLYWGELHNHNELGYAQGTLERSYEIARSHLDFYAFTPHAVHADGGAPEGYPVVRENWERIQREAAANNQPGKFTCFLGYEWHSNAWGHVHVIYFEDDQPLHAAPNLEALQTHFQHQEAILVPHHIAYDHGVDWELFDEQLSPVVEIFSEHGCSERDVGLHPMQGHSGGPGPSRFTAQGGLARGKRFGFVAGTDNHDGHPGGYGLGLTGVLAADNTRAAIAEALRSRRTLAVTGDRIAIDFNAGQVPMGSAVAAGEVDELSFRVQGWDFIKQVEVVRDNVSVLVRTPDYGTAEEGGESLYRLRLEWGWGPMKGYQVFDWEGRVQVEDGELEQVVPCFCSDPFDEQRRKQVLFRDETTCRWQSHTSRGSVFTTRNGTLSCSPNDALCLEVRGTEKTRVALDLSCETHKSLLATTTDWSISPCLGRQQRCFTVGELLEGRQGFRMEGVPTWAVVHRAVPPGLYTVSGGYNERLEEPACYYLRVTQENGQMAWASPIWLTG